MTASASKKHKSADSAAEEAVPQTPAMDAGTDVSENADAPHDGAEHSFPEDTSLDSKLSELAELKEKAALLEEDATRFKEEAQRARADLYNYRTKVEKERERERAWAAERAVDSLLPVLDDLDRTLAAVTDKESQIYKGVAMVQRRFFAAMQGLGLSPISAEGAFNPALHEAIMVVNVDDEACDGMIVEELHRGYMLGDRVLRASQVKVGKKTA